MITFNTETRAFTISGTVPSEGHDSSTGKTEVLYTEGGALSPTERFTLSIYRKKGAAASKPAKGK